MKNNTLKPKAMAVLAFAFIALPLFFSSCKKSGPTYDTTLNSQGLTKEITNAVPQAIIDTMMALGMPIYGGATPPNLYPVSLNTATYLATPYTLIGSNISYDYAGEVFSDFQFTLYNQNNQHLTCNLDYINGNESGNGIGCYIVGKDSFFTVFAIENISISGYQAKSVEVISGVMHSNGITHYFSANFMINNNGNAGGVFIENGEGRVFDINNTDSFAPLQ